MAYCLAQVTMFGIEKLHPFDSCKYRWAGADLFSQHKQCIDEIPILLHLGGLMRRALTA